MYTHDLFYLQQEWEAWLAPVFTLTRFQARSKDQEILEEGSGAGPSS